MAQVEALKVMLVSKLTLYNSMKHSKTSHGLVSSHFAVNNLLFFNVTTTVIILNEVK